MGHTSSEGVHINGEGKQYYEQTLRVLLTTLFDATPKVQVAASSALCILVENAFYYTLSEEEEEVNILSAALPDILLAIHRAFDVYGIKSSLVLVDTVGTIADTLGAELAKPQYTAMYLPKLMERFFALEDLDQRMFPMLECLTSVLAVIGLEAQQYVQSIYLRCVKLCGEVLSMHHRQAATRAAVRLQKQQQQQQQQNGAVGAAAESPEFDLEDEDDTPSKDFVVCGLDVISALCEGLGDMFGTLVSDSSTRDVLFQLIFAALGDELAEVRQSGFSLAGEISKHSFLALAITPAEVTHILQHATHNLDYTEPLVCNNAAWTLGELALHVSGEFLIPFIPRAMHSLILGRFPCSNSILGNV
jgi:hypothetical protein